MKAETKCIFAALDQYVPGEEVLYVGCHPHRRSPKWLNEIKSRGATAVDALEIFQPNVLAIREQGIFRTVYHGSIASGTPKKYGLIFWWQGPEHLPRYTALETLKSLAAQHIHVIAGSPHGVYEQGPEYGNPHEVHVAHFLPEDFLSIGYQAEAFGPVNKRRSHIVLWR